MAPLNKDSAAPSAAYEAPPMERSVEQLDPNRTFVFPRDAIASALNKVTSAMSEVPGAWVLDLHSDPDHNRSVVTLAGEPEPVAEAALRGVAKAADLIDLRRHTGEHPRIGAIDVLPFVPIEGVNMDECIALARHAGREIWSRHGIPVYFYEEAAMRPERKKLEGVRSGEFEYLRKVSLRNADRVPDINGPGPASVRRSGGHRSAQISDRLQYQLEYARRRRGKKHRSSDSRLERRPAALESHRRRAEKPRARPGFHEPHGF